MARKFKGKRRKSSRKKSSRQIAERHLPLMASGSTGVGQAVFKAPNSLCAVNHRLYRGAYNYRMRFKTHNPTADASTMVYKFYTLANNWFVEGAIKYAFRQWRASLQEELAAGATVAKWADFRISSVNPDGDNANLYPRTFDGDTYNAITQDDIADTSAMGADGSTAKGFHLFGALSNSFNIFEEYANHLSTRQADDPTVTFETSYAGLNQGVEGAALLATQGDDPPYDLDMQVNWSDAVLMLKDSIVYDGNAGVSSVSTVTFDAPLGLVFIVRSDDGTDTDFSETLIELSCILSPGDYKGVHASPIVRWPRSLLGASAKSMGKR